MMTKPWWQSRIVWAQLASILIVILAYMASAGVFEGLGLPTARAEVARNWVALATVLLNAVTVACRWGPQTPVGWRGQR